MPQCDFCNSTEIAWRYRASNFMIQTKLKLRGQDFEFPWGSNGDWAACETCSSLIEAGDWDALADRSVRTSPFLSLLHKDEIPGLKEAILRLHRAFRNKRVGQRTYEAA